MADFVAGSPVLVALLVVVAFVLGWRASRPLTDAAVVATSPWILTAAAVAVWVQHAAPPGLLKTVGQPPLGYLVALTAAATLWAVLQQFDTTARTRSVALGVVGSFLAVPALALAVADTAPLRPVVPLASLALSGVLSAVVWWRFGRYFPTIRASAGLPGALVVFAHLLDGTTTAIGIDRLGLAEQTPLLRVVLTAVDGVPLASVTGVGWVLILLKIGVALLSLWYVPQYLARTDHDSKYLFALVAAFGLGPGVQNLLILLS